MEKRIRMSFRRLAYSALLVFVVVSVSKFAYITVESYRLHQEVDRLTAIIESDNKVYKRLQEQKEYVTSPEYVERVARGEFQMAKEGEINITPIFPQGTDLSIWDEPLPTVQAERPGQPNWQKWWDLFFPSG
ncbi:MAG: hypothetical protein GXP41_10220 [Chloroflexi bacterium]|nr:hypothetical protein [Chloroflexota bacterium]